MGVCGYRGGLPGHQEGGPCLGLPPGGGDQGDMTRLPSPAHVSPRFVPRRRFPWNIILLTIFVSGLGLVGGA